MKPTKYELEIRSEGRGDNIYLHLESETPFQAIQKGDRFPPGSFDGFPESVGDFNALIADRIEHVFVHKWLEIKLHKVVVYTKVVPRLDD